MSALAYRGLRHIAELAARKPHGTRLRYKAGCKCLKCRMANSNYETTRARARKAGDWNGIVDAGEARTHILKLGRRGVGYKQVARAAGVGKTTLLEVRTGRKRRIRARSARAILQVTKDMKAPHAYTAAHRLWRRIHALLEEGFTRSDLARLLGYRRCGLQFNRRVVTVANDRAVALLHRRLTT